jgi:hypothetical protein
MYVVQNWKFGPTKTKPPVPAVELNGSAPTHLRHASPIASMQTSAGQSLKNAKDKQLFSLLRFFLIWNLFLASVNYNNNQSNGIVSFHSVSLAMHA